MPDSFERDDAAEAAQVLLAVGAEFHGLIALAGPARVDGLLRGELIGPGPLWIGPRANVEARVETDEVSIAGTLKGEIRASRRVALAPTARVRGELHTPSLSLAEGALLEGRCESGSSPPRAPESPAGDRESGPASS
jgi:cytoskeletal protein CcmA (bactofilin family)